MTRRTWRSLGLGVEGARVKKRTCISDKKGKIEAGIFARVIQDIEDACLDKSRRVLRSSGWTARSWQQDGLLVEGEVGIEASKERLEGAMRKAEAAVAAGVTVGGQMVAGLEIELLHKPFLKEATEPTLPVLSRT